MRLPLLFFVLAHASSLGACAGPRPPAEVVPPASVPAGEDAPGAGPQAIVPGARWSRRPRPGAQASGSKWRAVPDGKLDEWDSAEGVSWVELPQPSAVSPGWSGPADLSVRVGWASYTGGLNLLIKVRDDVHRPAKVHAALGKSDGIELALWPLAAETADKRKESHPSVGVRFRLGTSKELVAFVAPNEPWRAAAVSSFGVAVPGGWVIEARVPLRALTPLPSAKVEALRYRLTVRDQDGEGTGTSLVHSGVMALKTPMRVPEAVGERLWLRSCMARFADRAFWTFAHGWHCGVAYRDRAQADDDATREAPAPFLFSYPRRPEVPRLSYLRERIVLMNFPGIGRGLIALVLPKERLASLLDLGVIGADDPGNALARSGDAEALRLPDGTWAVAVTHASPSLGPEPLQLLAPSTVPFGDSCRAGHRVELSIIALSGARHRAAGVAAPLSPSSASTDSGGPGAAGGGTAKEPLPRLREVFRATLGDCRERSAFDWSISKDRKLIVLRDVLRPQRPPRRYVFVAGRYRLEGRSEPRQKEARLALGAPKGRGR